MFCTHIPTALSYRAYIPQLGRQSSVYASNPWQVAATNMTDIDPRVSSRHKPLLIEYYPEYIGEFLSWNNNCLQYNFVT